VYPRIITIILFIMGESKNILLSGVIIKITIKTIEIKE
jgi:hypothetical protein